MQPRPATVYRYAEFGAIPPPPRALVVGQRITQDTVDQIKQIINERRGTGVTDPAQLSRWSA